MAFGSFADAQSIQGYRMPGEFEPHTQTWMLWPVRPDNWRNGAKPAQKAWVSVATAISQFEPVTVGVPNEQYQNARARLPPSVRVVEISADDAWVRDSGPTFVVNNSGGVIGVDWEFNAWGGLQGGCYFPWDKDRLVARKICQMERVPRHYVPIVLEGGSIHVDGEGTLITTEECLLNPNRNPNLSREQIEIVLKDTLGVKVIIWLKQGLFNDQDTNGHVDNLATFLKPGVIALHWTDHEKDENYERVHDAMDRILAATDARGRKIQVLKLYQPSPMFIKEEEAITCDHVDDVTNISHAATSPDPSANHESSTDPALRLSNQATERGGPGYRMPATYANFLIVNGGVVIPGFDDPIYDKLAVETLQQFYGSERKVVQVPYGREILLGGGNIHCITQQQPAPQNS